MTFSFFHREGSKWSRVHWIAGAGSKAVRQQRSDGLWCITEGVGEVRIIAGPFATLEAVEMLLQMGAVEL